MFARNNRISMRQVYRLFVFDLIGISTLVLPVKLAAFSGSDGLLGILIGGGLASVYLWYLSAVLKGMQTDFISYVRVELPNWLGKGIFFLLSVHALWIAAFGAYIFTDVMKQGLLPGESFTLILLLILFVSCYSVKGGMECRARVYEMMFWLLALALLLLLLLAAFHMNLDYIGPFFEASVDGVIKGSILVFFCFLPLFAILLFPAYIEKGKNKELVRTVCKALWTAVFILFILYLVLVGTFGQGALQTMRYPAVTLMSNIQLRGHFFRRFDAFMLGIWFFTLFALLNLFLYYGSHFLQLVFSPDKKFLCFLGFAAILVFAGALLFRKQEFLVFFLNYFCYVGMPMFLLLPALSLFAGKYKKGDAKVSKAKEERESVCVQNGKS